MEYIVKNNSIQQKFVNFQKARTGIRTQEYSGSALTLRVELGILFQTATERVNHFAIPAAFDLLNDADRISDSSLRMLTKSLDLSVYA